MPPPFSPASLATLVARDITFERGGRTVLDRVSVTLSPETCLGVVGPNGVGKSTLLQVLAGSLAPLSGTVRADPPAATVGYLAQEQSSLPGETLRQAVTRRTGPHQRDPTRKRPFLFKPASSGEASRVFSLSLGGEPPSNSAPLLPLLHKSVEERVGERSFPPQISRILHSAFCILHSAFSCPPHPWFKSLQCNSVESCNSNKILTAKERKEHIDKSLWLLFFAICAFFVVNSSLVAALPRCAFESLRLCVEFLLLAASPRRLPFRQMSLNWIPGRLKL